MKPWFTLALAVLLAGCGGKSTELPEGWLSVIEAETPKPPEPPEECQTKGDPKWKRPPQGSEHTADTARREQANKTAFAELEHRRRICAAGFTKLQ